MSTKPILIRTPAALRLALAPFRRSGERVGLVPTMGALHSGHLSLAARSAQACAVTVVSIFVNPTQFGAGEDYGRYPRTLKADLALLAVLPKVLAFAPAVGVMYPDGDATRVKVEAPLTRVLEGAARPAHFEGVATVVAKLFSLVGPCTAYFGEKDWQQLQVVRRLARDLCLPVEVQGCPTVREADGVALSSRNAYLSPAERSLAPRLKQALDAARAGVRQGLSPAAAARRARRLLERGGAFKADYLAIADAETLQAPRPGRPRRALAAARLGTTRLIDNISV